MPLEKSSGAIVFKREEGEVYYLLLLYEWGHWGFPKGNIEEGESLEETARREIKEETGLEVDFIEGFKEWIKYFYKIDDRNVFKIATYLLAEAKGKEVTLSHEHDDYEWLKFNEAVKRLNFDNAKEVLKKANNFLEDYASIS